MRTFGRGALSRWMLTVFVVGAAACAPAAPSPVAPAAGAKLAAATSPPAARAEPAEGPVASLRTGELPPIDHRDPARATVVARAVDDRYETLVLDLVLPLSAAFDWSERVGCRVSIDQDGAKPYAFAAMPDDVSAVEGRGFGAATIWMRRPRDQEGQPATGIVFTPQLGSEPGHKVRFRAATDVKGKSDPKVIGRWAAAFAKHLGEIGKGPWFEFAARRVAEVYGTKKKGAAALAPRPSRGTEELVRLMETTTGLLSVQEALQHDRPLLLATSKEKRTVPIAKLVAPASAPHPWDEMLRNAKPAPPEPLAAAVPAEFWYVRAADIPKLFLMADQLDAWGTPAANLFDQSLDERDLEQRYETQLGIVRTAIGRIVGPEILSAVALAGSDPYLREGSDVTAIFQVRNAPLFGAAIDGMLATHAQAHGGTTKTSVTHGSARIDVSTSPDGAIRQHRTTVNDLEIVSNSLTAVKGVLDAIGGKRPRLSDEKDFRYLLARDKGDDTVLAFYGDRFVAAAVGAKQKVLEARRQMAAAELMTPGFAALLYGWIHGKAPLSVDELIGSKLLTKDELKHMGGTPIEWSPGQAARSMWGTPSALTPLLDLPEPDLASESERAAYERFSRTYETYWSRYIDPAALRLGLSGPDPGVVSAELRVLPLIEGTDYREIIELAGQARVSVSPLLDGLRAVVGIGPTAKVRRELTRLARGSFGRHGFGFDFLGDWALVGVADRTRLADIAKKFRLELPEAPESEPSERFDEIAEAARIPAYAAVEIRSKSGAALALGAARKMADEALHGTLSWGEAGTEHGTTLFRVAVGKGDEGANEARKGGEPDLSIFYALTDKAFLISLDEGVLRQLVADVAEGRGPAARTGKASTDASQLVIDLAGKREGGLLTVAGWLLSAQLVRASAPSRLRAEALLRGAPERASDPAAVRALSLAYFGAVPTPPFGGAYALGADGVHDPSLGSASAPRWPRLPVDGSSIDRLFGAVGRLRSEIAFDSEGSDGRSGGGIESLHVRAAIGLR